MPADPSPSVDELTQAAMAALAANRLDEALEHAVRARAAAPSNPFAYLNEAVALRALRRLDDAAQAVAEARRLAPADPAIAYNLAMIALSRGQWEDGWRFLEIRLMLPNRRPFRFSQRAPRAWRGEDLAGHSLQIRWEEGYGDTIQMLRYVRPLAAAGCAVHLDVQKPLLALAEAMPGVASASASEGDEAVCGIADFSLPALSLPRRMGECLDHPCQPYLSTDPERLKRWRSRLSGHPRPWIVVQWQGAPGHALDSVRSIPAGTMTAALAASGGTLISVHKGATTSPPGVVECGPDIVDFADSAAILALADHIVTVDTAIAHLAGAMGLKAHLLVAVNADWRWLAPGSSRWYPSLHLHHQTTPGDWSAPLAAAAGEIL